jgi:hypothetical protein
MNGHEAQGEDEDEAKQISIGRQGYQADKTLRIEDRGLCIHVEFQMGV